jgi:hypothetical protein
VTLIYLFPTVHVYLWGLLGLSLATAILVGTLRSRPAHRLTWVVIAIGVTTVALGDIGYDVLAEFMHELNPFPSIADTFYLVTYLLIAAGVVAMVRARRPRDDGSGPWLDALIVTSGMGCDSVQGYLFARPAPALYIVATFRELQLTQVVA